MFFITLKLKSRFQYRMVCHTGNINTPFLDTYFTDSRFISVLHYMIFTYQCITN
jgi:hypothetical protein